MATLSAPRLAGELLVESIRSKQGSMPILVLAILCFTTTAWVTATVAGGFSMFVDRAAGRGAAIDQEILAENPDQSLYVFFAALACVFLVPALISLSVNAAILGASGREYRLATLRLLGLDTGAVNRMALSETLVEAMIGIVLGTVISFLTAPIWSGVSFQNTPIEVDEMFLPWWGYLIEWVALISITAVSALLGLWRVSITPLGVARKEPPRNLRLWRLLVFLFLFICCVVTAKMVNVFNNAGLAWLGLLLLISLLVFNLAMAFVVQIVARVISRIPGMPTVAFVSLQRIAAQPSQAWSRVATMGFLAILLGGISALPESLEPSETASLQMALIQDLKTGSFLTIGLAFLINAVSTLLTQTALVYQQRDLGIALHRIGVPSGFTDRVAVIEILVPLILSTVVGVVFGHSVIGSANPVGSGDSTEVILIVLGLGYFLVGAALGTAILFRHANDRPSLQALSHAR